MARVLVADDFGLMRNIAKAALQAGGHTVIEAQDGLEAVELAKMSKPDLIMLDAEMPDMDGWEACKTIKSDPATQQIPVIICTGNDLADEPELLTQNGANGYIMKPYKEEQLLAKVKEFVPQ